MYQLEGNTIFLAFEKFALHGQNALFFYKLLKLATKMEVAVSGHNHVKGNHESSQQNEHSKFGTKPSACRTNMTIKMANLREPNKLKEYERDIEGNGNHT